MVLSHLGEPDKVSRLNVQRAGRPTNLYCADRVQQLEQSKPEVAHDLALTKALAGRLQNAAAYRLRMMGDLVAQVEFAALPDSIESVLADIHLKNKSVSTPSELHRLALETLLGTLESTVDALDNFSWQAGVCEARKLLRDRMLTHIAQTYPLLGRAVFLYRSSPSG